MKAVHKFKLPLEGVAKLELAEGSRVIRSEYIISAKAIYIWIEQPLNVDAPKHNRQFHVIRSGQPFPKEYRHVGSALDSYTPEAYHIYEQPNTEANLNSKRGTDLAAA